MGVIRQRALATLYGKSEVGEDYRRLRLGGELRGLDGALGWLSLGLYGERSERQMSVPENAIMLEGYAGF